MTSDNTDDYDHRAADVAARLESIADELAATVGTGDGIVPPPGSPEDLAIEAAFDEAFPNTRRRSDEETDAAMQFADGVLGAAGRTLDPSVRPIARDFAAGRITHDEYRRQAGLVDPDEVERQQRQRRLSDDYKAGLIDEETFLRRFLYGDD
ncbi:hypothetical protein GII30_22230 [Gordonia amarae]|uniref:Uncharacterized protein n=2 Tax=Gordonia amarae TaxID=36821 RepID=G7GLU1_9ACTN|nr:hypothetical protein [Gordonia amarae]MCS3876503.1 hypothetical protein [Gordonia amarae]QHN19411.1 hypothetical protein GII35_22695 [Gordonia amarae]QHN23887.1 hypothetical protein GII34_22195 [Gordonia amarae]QHN32797.1 hypothetical protein GII32_22525 [Gordonia amarae]QHN41516.1 hypothetical protein GII30_22230 [Gordonia amarae]